MQKSLVSPNNDNQTVSTTLIGFEAMIAITRKTHNITRMEILKRRTQQEEHSNKKQLIALRPHSKK